MRIIKTGDPCPLCGRPVTAEDRETLDQLTAIAQMLDRLGIDIAADAAAEQFRRKGAGRRGEDGQENGVPDLQEESSVCRRP